MINWKHKRTVRMILPKNVNPRQAELQAAKEILAEIFRVRTFEVEEMIRRRLDESNRIVEQKEFPHHWPATFCLGK